MERSTVKIACHALSKKILIDSSFYLYRKRHEASLIVDSQIHYLCPSDRQFGCMKNVSTIRSLFRWRIGAHIIFLTVRRRRVD